jgi:hypothetical protein
MPAGYAPAIAGSAAVALVLPVFLAAGWRLSGWLLGAVLWGVGLALGLLLARLPIGPSNLAGSGVRGIGMTFRAIVVMVVVIAVAVDDAGLALAAAGVYALGYTLELALALLTYFSGEPVS